MGEFWHWWYARPVHGILFGVLCVQLINLLHHWLVIYLKWLVYRATMRMLLVVQAGQEQMAAALIEIQESTRISRAWHELTRIQASNTKELNKSVAKQVDEVHAVTESVKGQVDANTAGLSQQIEKVPDKVVERLEAKAADSGAHKFPAPGGG